MGFGRFTSPRALFTVTDVSFKTSRYVRARLKDSEKTADGTLSLEMRDLGRGRAAGSLRQCAGWYGTD